MKKVLLMLAAMLPLTLMISCGDSGDDCENLDSKCDGTVAMTCLAGKWEKEDCAEKSLVCDLIMDLAACVDAKNDSEPDEDEITDTEEPDNEVPDETTCALDNTWMTPDDAWTSWGYLKIMGPVGEYNGDEYVPAVFVEGKINLSEITKEFGDGSIMNYGGGQALLANPYNYDFLNQTATSATADYWDAMYQFNPALIPAMKEEGSREAGFGATVFFRHSYIDLTISGQSITGQFTRKNCFVGLSKTAPEEIDGQTYDVPIGDMYGCFDKNIDGSVGEDLKMMFRNEFTEDEEAMLKYFNMQEDGTVLEYGQEGYTHLCACFAADGVTEVNCWNEYDGPGGKEDCPAVVEAAGECGTVETDEDVIDADTDTADEDTNDDDPYVNPCIPTNPCVEANKTVCTDTNEDGIAECGCDVDYHLNNSNECKSNTKTTPCIDNAPANATSTVVDVEVTWNGTGWNTAADCEWTCDEDFHSEDGLTCVSDTKMADCIDNAPENATSTPAQVEIAWNGTAWNTAADCNWSCNDYFEVNESGTGCDPIPEDPCDPNQCLTTDYSDGNCAVDGLSYSCGCNENNTWNAISKTCVPDVKDAACSNVLTDHSHYTGIYSEGTFVQTWNNSTNEFEPVTFNCTWACNTNYSNEDGSCVADTRRTPCENIPAHASGTTPNEDNNFGQTWDENSGTAGEWLPATAECNWACNFNYNEVDGSCVAKTKTADCVNEIPEKSVYANSGKFDQTWDGDAEEWLPYPADFECGWQCAKGYQLNETEDGCVPWMTIYVDQNADGLNNGQNWTDAFTSLHSALEIAAAGQEIWVAEGTYKPEACPMYRYETDCLNQKNKHFRLVPDVAILGGFAGGETLSSERNPAVNVVVLSGDLDGNDSEDIKTDNSYNIFRIDYGIDYTTATIIDGVTISGGYADSTIDGELWNAAGGAVQLQSKSATFRNCLFVDNFAAQVGGAISCGAGTKLVIEDSQFIDNFASQGGGAINAHEGAEVIIKDSQFTGNSNLIHDSEGSGTSSGGAISIWKGSVLDISDALFKENVSDNGGAVNASNMVVNIENTTFDSNYAKYRSGAVSVSNYETPSDLNISGCIFISNSTDTDPENGSHEGGAVSFNDGKISIVDTEFNANTSISGAALNLSRIDAGSKIADSDFVNNVVTFKHNDDSVVKVQEGELLVINSDFIGNTGTALRNQAGDLTVESCSFINNAGSMGVGINNSRGNLTLNDSFFENNQATVNVGGLSRLAGAIALIGMDDNMLPVSGISARINNTVFANNSAGMWGGAILNAKYPDAVFTNCTFYNNNDSSGNAIVHASVGESTGDPVPGVVYNNSIIWDDVAVLEGSLGGGMVFGTSKISFKNSDVMGSGGSSAWNVAFVKSVMGGAITTTDFVDNGGNIDADPEFIGSGENPLTVASSSPCIDAGNNALVPVEMTTDILGNARVYNTTVDMGAYEFNPCNPNPCGGATPNCFEDATPQGYTCYPSYSIGWCVTQYPKTFEGAVGDKVDIYGRVWIDGLTNTTVDATDVHPLVKAQFGGAPAGTPVADWASDAWVNADPNMAGGADWDNNDEYMVLQHEMKNIGEFDYAFRFSADGGKTWTVCDTEGNMPYHTDKLGYAAVNECMENADCTDPAKPLCSADTYSCVNNAVFFSEYVEGSGTGNKALEIYNGSTSAVNLSAYTLSQVTNGGSWGEVSLTLSGTLAAGDVYVICHPTIPDASQCDLLSGTSANFNGDDALAIFFNGVIIDQIGVEGADPGTGWAVAGTIDATANHTLVRKPAISSGTANWTSSAGTSVEDSQWTIYAQDDLTHLGVR